MSISEKDTREGAGERQTRLAEQGAQGEIQRERDAETEGERERARDLIYRHFKNRNFIRICSSPSLKGSSADR